MAYTQEPARFAEQIAAARDIAGGRAVWAGIGSYRLSPAQTIEHIQAARKLGAAGFVLFSYDSLTGPTPPAPDYLATVSRGAFGTTRSTDNSSR
jgi:dihydrodipicolinate synthase/N-acetylneuraminate lyase